jgi:hypothetical protein
MAKKRKPKTTAQKRGPKEERLIITGDPQVALDRLLKKPPDKHR